MLAVAFPIANFAEWTSRVTLATFILVCLALVAIKLRGTPAPERTFIVPLWVPVSGALSSGGLLAFGGY